MKANSCAQEPEVLAAVLEGRLCGELEAHARHCAICGEVAHVATLVRADFAAASRETSLPTADVVLLRAQIRAREEAARAAARPILLTHAIGIAALLGLLVSLAGKFSVGAWTSLTMFDGSARVLVPVAIGLVTSLVVAPLALYFAFSRD
jgi:hypothetical protein